ncbi:zinc finger protein ZIC 3, partial [Sigmodon hispidus]
VVRRQGPKWALKCPLDRKGAAVRRIFSGQSFFSLSECRAHEACLGPLGGRPIQERPSSAPPLVEAWLQLPTASQARRNPHRDSEQPPPHLPGAPQLPNQLWSPGSGCHVLRFPLPINVVLANGRQGRRS